MSSATTAMIVVNKNHLQQINETAITNFKTQKFKFPNADLENNCIDDDHAPQNENNTVKLETSKKKIRCRIDCIFILVILTLVLIGYLLHLFYGLHNTNNIHNNNNNNYSKINEIILSNNQRLIVNNSVLNEKSFIFNNNSINNYNINYNKSNESSLTLKPNIHKTSISSLSSLSTLPTPLPTPLPTSTSLFLSTLLPSITDTSDTNDAATQLPVDNDHYFDLDSYDHAAFSHDYPEDNNAEDNAKLLEIVKNGLGLKTIPDITKANISQAEYVTKYTEYLERVRARQLREFAYIGNSDSPLEFKSVNYNSTDSNDFRMKRSLAETKNNGNHTKTRNPNPANLMYIRFPLNIDDYMQSAASVEEANIRLLLATNPSMSPHRHSNKRKNRYRNKKLMDAQPPKVGDDNDDNDNYQKRAKKKHMLHMKVFQLIEPKGRVWLDGKKIEIDLDDTLNEETITQWLQFDVTTAVESWISGKRANLGLEIQCDNCYRLGARIIDDHDHLSTADDDDKRFDDGLGPVLNIIGRKGAHSEKRTKQHQHQQKTGRKPRKTDCYKENQRCCRHNMEVILKEIKGFEFILEPRKFDAGYCKGRCPPRYNPAHHHALLQSLIWKKDHNRAPKPCCAPSKLAELEVLHYDEKDPSKLKTTTWAGMRVLECACS